MCSGSSYRLLWANRRITLSSNTTSSTSTVRAYVFEEHNRKPSRYNRCTYVFVHLRSPGNGTETHVNIRMPIQIYMHVYRMKYKRKTIKLRRSLRNCTNMQNNIMVLLLEWFFLLFIFILFSPAFLKNTEVRKCLNIKQQLSGVENIFAILQLCVCLCAMSGCNWMSALQNVNAGGSCRSADIIICFHCSII